MHPATATQLLAPSLDLKPIATTVPSAGAPGAINPTATPGSNTVSGAVSARLHAGRSRTTVPGAGARGQERHPFRLSAEACRLFTPLDAVRMNFIPQMLNAAAMQYSLDLCDHCARHRYSHLKRATRAVKDGIGRYADNLARAFGDHCAVYEYYINRYWDSARITLTQTGFTVKNQVHRLHPQCKDPELAARCWIAHALIDHAEAIDRSWDAEIDRRFGRHIHRLQDPALKVILKLLQQIEHSLNTPLPKDNPDIQLCMQVLANSAHTLADELIEEDTKA